MHVRYPHAATTVVSFRCSQESTQQCQLHRLSSRRTEKVCSSMISPELHDIADTNPGCRIVPPTRPRIRTTTVLTVSRVAKTVVFGGSSFSRSSEAYKSGLEGHNGRTWTEMMVPSQDSAT